jgi:hypothetical protein
MTLFKRSFFTKKKYELSKKIHDKEHLRKNSMLKGMRKQREG